ncbi:uncharacterized protein LOC134695889 [Mytilus trossulus]|uniref:uncharacterized protein LOC134695889 n=1 Tax=Mytilus trossulus TaxID=6551 RepID=UPI003003C502
MNAGVIINCCLSCCQSLLKIPIQIMVWILEKFFWVLECMRYFTRQIRNKALGYEKVNVGEELHMVEVGNGTSNDRQVIEDRIRLQQQENQLEQARDEILRLQECNREMGSLRNENNHNVKILEQKEHDLKVARDEVLRLQECNREIGPLRNENNHSVKMLQDYKEKVNELQREKSDALTRLSEVMGSKLRDNNPAITDLNDTNRPMKLGDQFSELYENEWTDAYSELEDSKKLTEIEIIEILIKILKEIYETCLADVSQQLSGHRSAVHGLSDDEIEGFIKAVKDSIKTNASKYIPLLLKKIASDSSSCKTVVQYRDCCLAYIENCVNLCYYITVQDPPMVIDFVPGHIFDKQSWKEYTRSGTEVEYVVWPALYLYKGGPIMSKGVVQPKENTH